MTTINQLWDKALPFLYNRDAYVAELDETFQAQGVKKSDLIVDITAGSGFPIIDLAQRGYTNLRAFDGSREMKKLFDLYAQQKGVSIRLEVRTRERLEEKLGGKKAKVIICRGNSLIYFGGLWDRVEETTNLQRTKKVAEQRKARIQNACLEVGECTQEGSIFYVDKFHDGKPPHEETVGVVQTDIGPQTIFWRVTYNKEHNERVWTLGTRNQRGEVTGTYPNAAYKLTEKELKAMLRVAGFGSVQKLDMKQETHYMVLMGKK